jgi:hypothetical protein
MNTGTSAKPARTIRLHSVKAHPAHDQPTPSAPDPFGGAWLQAYIEWDRPVLLSGHYLLEDLSPCWLWVGHTHFANRRWIIDRNDLPADVQKELTQ